MASFDYNWCWILLCFMCCLCSTNKPHVVLIEHFCSSMVLFGEDWIQHFQDDPDQSYMVLVVLISLLVLK